ncbi:MAG TPA: DUF424 family protein [Euryarchaeota archaeon]|nr:DUF424 family protein [Euryarchaeota archaeon]
MIIRIFKRGKEIVLAACDWDLLGKTLRSGEIKLHVSKKFYGEEPGDREALVAGLRSCTTANLVGERVVRIAVDAGFIDEGGIIVIEGVPHAQLFKMI